MLARQGRAALREARALAAVPLHKLRGTDPNWRFEQVLAAEAARGVSSTFFVMAGHRHPADGAAPEAYERLRPKLVRTLLDGGGEVGLHGSYTAAADLELLAEEKRVLEALAGPIDGHRYHYLRVDVEDNLVPLARAGLPLRHVPRLRGRPGLPGRDRPSVPAVGLGGRRAGAASSRSPSR